MMHVFWCGVGGRSQGIKVDPDRDEWLATEGGMRGGIEQKLARVR